MGGFGSGVKHEVSKRTTASCWQLDIRHLQRSGLFNLGVSYELNWNQGAFSIRMDVGNDGSVRLTRNTSISSCSLQVHDQRIRYTCTNCHLGGKRAWFICPINNCEKRVAILYSKGGVFACRHCHNLAYYSQRLNHQDRCFRKADNIRDKLGWVPGIAHGVGFKPKGMHRQTYWKLLNQYNDAVEYILGYSIKFLENY